MLSWHCPFTPRQMLVQLTLLINGLILSDQHYQFTNTNTTHIQIQIQQECNTNTDGHPAHLIDKRPYLTGITNLQTQIQTQLFSCSP